MVLDEPLVSIGLPIYNAGAETRKIIECVLAQDYQDFELIVSDNASTDDTWSICQEYAQRDSRIRLYRNETNQGALINFERVFELATGKYFAWIAHDDYWEPGYIEACVKKLESESTAVLCYSDQLFTNTHTGVVAEVKYTFRGDHPKFGGRVRALLAKNPAPYSVIYGVYRREIVQHAFPIPQTAINDIHFLLKVSKYGTFVHVPQTLFRRHVTPKGFHQQMQRVFNRRFVLPRSLVYVSFLARLLHFAFTEGQGLAEKLQVAWAVSRYVGYKIILYAIPDEVRHAIKTTIRRWIK
ncbi:MAG: glycosyltransferase family 2 protein [Anaerolineaceae bacterium]|nr:glycosyltransferase family 2 protein [Anaerolineaceae bacterium]